MAVKTNAKTVISSLDRKFKNMDKATKLAAVQGMELFSGKIQKEQMSGRPGLKTQTGNLKRSWVVRAQQKKFFQVLLFTRAIYARIHQYGGVIKAKSQPPYLKFKIKNKWFQKKSVKIPKRLNVFEDFKRSGKRMIKERVKLAMRVTLK